MNLDPKLVLVLLEVGRSIWNAITDRDDNQERAKAIARAALDAAIQEARHQAELLGVVIAHDALDAAMKLLMDAFVAKGTFPQLGLHIEIVKEITDEDRERERANWDELKTPVEKPAPDGGSER